MSENKGKKNWSKPGMVVLVRNKPGEAVLTHCKRAKTELDGPKGFGDQGCTGEPPGNCGNCHSRAGS
ncbi:MAG: hypothetical protein R6V02_05290 [Candidatus Aminicenantes bacterium]